MSILENGRRRGYIIYRHEVINDFSNKFINEISLSKTITYATKQLGFEKIIEHQRNCTLAILQERDVFMAMPTGSEGVTDLPNDFLGTRLHESSFFERQLDGDEISTGDNTTDFFRERSDTSVAREKRRCHFLVC